MSHPTFELSWSWVGVVTIEEEPKNEDDHIKRLLKKGRGTQKWGWPQK